MPSIIIKISVAIAIMATSVFGLAQSGAAQTTLGTAANSLAAGEWMSLYTNNMDEVLSASGSSKHILSYTDELNWDPVTKQLFFFGGDHADDAQFISYTEDTNTWQRLPREPWMFTFGVTGGMSDHGYDHNGIDISGRRFFHRPLYESIVHIYDIDTGVWSKSPSFGDVVGNINCCGAIEYFPGLGTVFFSGGKLALLRDGASAWEMLSPRLEAGGWHNFTEYNAVHNVMVFGGGVNSNDLYRLDPDGTVTALKPAPIILGIRDTVFTVDPVSGEFLVFTTNKEFYTYDVTTDTWALQTNAPPVWVDCNYTSGIKGVTATPVITHGVTVFTTCGRDGPSYSRLIVYKHLAAGDTPPPLPPEPEPPDLSGVGGYPMPDLTNERGTYANWGWTWAPEVEPDFLDDSNYVVNNPDIHGNSEGDDLWTYLMMYLRTGEQGYLDRATAWKNYFLTARSSGSFQFDLNSFGSDHMYGWGLVAWYEFTGEQAALDEAVELAAVVESLWDRATSVYLCYTKDGCMWWGVRAIGRQLHLVTRVAEVTDDQRWLTLRDKILTTLMTSTRWNDQFGMYFRGSQRMSPFQAAVLYEAMAHVYRITGRQDVKERLVAMSRFVAQYGLDPIYQYSGSHLKIVDGAIVHSYAEADPVTFWDPVYTTSFVNMLVWGYKLTGDPPLLDAARNFFNRGTKGKYGSTTEREAVDNVVGHFIDTKFDTSSGNFFLAFNKGELQYTYVIFENDGAPTVLPEPPVTEPEPPVTEPEPPVTEPEPNQAPIAIADGVATGEDTAVVVVVLGNDSDPDIGDTLSVSAVTQGANGNVVINGDNTVTYTPNANFNGVDSFTYTVDDGNGGSDIATVNVTVNAVNDAPIADAGRDFSVEFKRRGWVDVVLDGSASTDPEGGIASYEWKIGDEIVGVGERPMVRLHSGIHDIILTVVDNKGATDSDDVTVTAIKKKGQR